MVSSNTYIFYQRIFLCAIGAILQLAIAILRTFRAASEDRYNHLLYLVVQEVVPHVLEEQVL